MTTLKFVRIYKLNLKKKIGNDGKNENIKYTKLRMQ